MAVIVVGRGSGDRISIGQSTVIGCRTVLDFRPVFPLHDVRKWPQNGFLASSFFVVVVVFDVVVVCLFVLFVCFVCLFFVVVFLARGYFYLEIIQ